MTPNRANGFAGSSRVAARVDRAAASRASVTPADGRFARIVCRFTTKERLSMIYVSHAGEHRFESDSGPHPQPTTAPPLPPATKIETPTRHALKAGADVRFGASFPAPRVRSVAA
jgi:hypothetical protein